MIHDVVLAAAVPNDGPSLELVAVRDKKHRFTIACVGSSEQRRFRLAFDGRSERCQEVRLIRDHALSLGRHGSDTRLAANDVNVLGITRCCWCIVLMVGNSAGGDGGGGGGGGGGDGGSGGGGGRLAPAVALTYMPCQIPCQASINGGRRPHEVY